MRRFRLFRSFQILAISAAVLLTASADARAQHTIRWKLKAGERIPYSMSQTIDMEMTVAGREQNMKIIQKMDMVWNVKKVDSKGIATLEQKISRIRMTMELPAPIGKVEYDSKTGKRPAIPQLGQMADAFDALANTGMTMSMTPRGVVKIQNLPPKLEALLKKQAGGAPGIGGGLSPDTLKQLANSIGAFLPAEAVSTGASWKQNMSMKLPFGEMNISSSNKLIGTERRNGRTIAKISVSPKMELKAKPGAPFKIELKTGGGSGTTLFDIDSGRLVSTVQKQKMEMNMEFGGQVISQKMNITTEVKPAGASAN